MKPLIHYCLAAATAISIILALTGCSTSSVGIPDRHQAQMDAYCAALGQESSSASGQPKTTEVFFSWKIHTCVQTQIYKKEGDDFSYDLNDISGGFFRGPSFIKVDSPLTLTFDNRYGMVLVDGWWSSTDPAPEKQLINNIAVHLECRRDERTCKERDGTLFMGMLGSEGHNYRIAFWDAHSVVADEEDDDKCGIEHRLVINAESKSVVVSDYPKKISDDPNCKAFQTANSYALEGGDIMLYGTSSIFSCSKDGVSSAIIAKVNDYKGKVSDKRYDLWQDDGAGGKPASVKGPSNTYTSAACEQAMQKKLAELKAD